MMVNKIGYLDAEKLYSDIIYDLDLNVTLTVKEYVYLIETLTKKGVVTLK